MGRGDGRVASSLGGRRMGAITVCYLGTDALCLARAMTLVISMTSDGGKVRERRRITCGLWCRLQPPVRGRELKIRKRMSMNCKVTEE